MLNELPPPVEDLRPVVMFLVEFAVTGTETPDGMLTACSLSDFTTGLSTVEVDNIFLFILSSCLRRFFSALRTQTVSKMF